MQDSRLDHLRQRLAAPPAPAWRPDQGDPNPLLGTVEALGERTHPEWGAYPTVTVVDEAGDRRCWHGWGAVARQQLDATCPRPGDAIAVSYDGERTSGAGRPYRVWRVEVERAPEHAFDDEVRQVPVGRNPGFGRAPAKSYEPFPSPEGEGPGGDAA